MVIRKKANCPPLLNPLNFTHYLTMPQAAGKKFNFNELFFLPSFDFEKILLEKTQKNAVALEHHKFIPFIFTTFCPYLGNDHISSYYHQMCGTPPAAINLWLFVYI